MPFPRPQGLVYTTATQTIKSAAVSESENDKITEVASRTARRFGQANASLSPATIVLQSITVQQDAVHELRHRQSCPSGTEFYHCANGFLGCCSVNPCNPGGSCPDGDTSSTPSASTTTTSTLHISSSSKPLTGNTTFTTGRLRSTNSSILTATSSGSAGASTGSVTGSAASVTPVPSCPAGNGTIFTDSSDIAYDIHCNADNSYPSQQTTTVETGGYGECFSACSLSSTCAGFTYVGLDSGDCYLKGAMPDDNYIDKNGTNYISCVKLNVTAVSPSPTPSSSVVSSTKRTNTGAIAGGVIGGMAALALVLVLIALLAKHRRKEIEKRRATVTHVYHGPIETQPMTSSPSNGGGHTRSGSTAHDAFAPFGGFYRGFSSAQADRQVEAEGLMAKHSQDRSIPLRDMLPGVQAERQDYILPSTTYKSQAEPLPDVVTMLDSTPIKRPLSQTSETRSPKFYEHIAEMEDTSNHAPPLPKQDKQSPTASEMESPTLGRKPTVSKGVDATNLADDIRRRQHLMSWNNYDAGHADERHDSGNSTATMAVSKGRPGQRQSQQVSPDTSDTPIDKEFIISPMGSVDHGRATS